MIICICRAISDRKMRADVAEGAHTPAAVFRASGAAPQCGRCVPSVKSLIEQALGVATAEESCCAVAAE